MVEFYIIRSIFTPYFFIMTFRPTGFTFIELMIVVAVIALLA
jgi:prepilin-type N-terminal cleavage/methylation domain-containing protein